MQTTKLSIDEFKQKVAKDWAGDEPANAWEKHYPAMKEQFALVTKAIVDAADPQPGHTVLDLAAGTGEPSLPIAKRVAPAGKVVATDFSKEMVEMVERNAQAEGITNIETKTVDAHELPFADESFDLVTSRFGVMFFAEVDKALSEVRRVLKPGGRIAFMVWGSPSPGTYFATTALPYVNRAATKPDPDGPGPMRFAEPGKLARIVEAAGFKNVSEESHILPAPYVGTPEEVLSAMMEIAAPIRIIADSLSDEDRAAAENEAVSALREHYDGSQTNVTAPVMVITATK
jgi:SAM-dependent methyltransferase